MSPRRRVLEPLALLLLVGASCGGSGGSIDREEGAGYSIEGLDHDAIVTILGSQGLDAFSYAGDAEIIVQVWNPCARMRWYEAVESKLLQFERGQSLVFNGGETLEFPDGTVLDIEFLGTSEETEIRNLQASIGNRDEAD